MTLVLRVGGEGAVTDAGVRGRGKRVVEIRIRGEEGIYFFSLSSVAFSL